MDDLSFLDKYTQPTKPVTTDYDGFIEESASRHGVDPELIRLQMGTESAFKPKAKSPKGASGLMQLMPGTARNLGVKDIYDPKQNIEGGVKYMRQLLDMFGGDVNLALAGYNAGEGAVQKYGNKIPPYKETRNYVKKIGGNYKGTGYHPSSLSFLDKYADTSTDALVIDAPADVPVDNGLSFLDKYVGEPEDTGAIYGMTDTDIKGGAATSPTFATQQPVSTDPVPETPDTLQRHVISTLDTNSPKKIAWLTKGNPANNYILSMAEARRLTRVDMPDGIALVNIDKLGITKDQAKAYVAKNGHAEDAGFVIDMGNNTGDGQPAVVALDPNTGKEVFAAVTPDPESAQVQAQKNAAMFPGTVQVPTNTDEVVANRLDEGTPPRAYKAVEGTPPRSDRPRTQEDINAEFEQWITVNGLPRNNDSVAKFNAFKQAEVDGENEIIKAMNVASDTTNLGIIGEAAKEGKSAKDALARQAEIQASYEKYLAATKQNDSAESRKAFNDEQGMQYEMAKQGIGQYNAQLPKGGTRTVARQKVAQIGTSSKSIKPVATTDAEYQAHVDDATKYGTPVLTREQFDKTANSAGSVGVRVNPNDFTVDGQRVTDFQTATREQGGEGYVPKEVGKQNDNLKGTAYIFRPDPNLSERDAAKAALEAAARANGVSGFSFAQYEQSRKGKSLFPTGYQSGDQIQVDYQALKDGGADIETKVRQKAVESRDNTKSIENIEASRRMDEIIRSKPYAFMKRVEELASDPKNLFLPNLVGEINSGKVADESWIESEKKRLFDEYGSTQKAYEQLKRYQDLDAGETILRTANQITRSFAKNVFSSTAKSGIFLSQLMEDVSPINKILPDEAKLGLRNVGNIADYFTRLISAGDATKAYNEMQWVKGTDDVDKQQLFRAVKEFDKAIGDDPVLKGRWFGKLGDAGGSALAFIAMGAMMPSMTTMNFWGKTTDWSLGVSGALQSAGTGYEEGKSAKLSEADAKAFGVIQGLLGMSEMVGAGAELAKYLKNPSMKRRFSEALLEYGADKAKHVYREGKQELGQEIFQTTSGKVVKEYLQDNDPSTLNKLTRALNRLPQQLVETSLQEGPIAALTGGGLGGATAFAQSSLPSGKGKQEKGVVVEDTPKVAIAEIQTANKAEPVTEKPKKVTLEPVEDIAKSDIPAKVIESFAKSDDADTPYSFERHKGGVYRRDNETGVIEKVDDPLDSNEPLLPKAEKPIATSPVRERAKAKAAEKFGVKGEAVDEAKEDVTDSPSGSHGKIYFRGETIGRSQTIKTGNKEWDDNLFVSTDENNAKLYSDNVSQYQAKPDAKILVEGSPEFNRLVKAKPYGTEMAMDRDVRALKAAKANGYDIVEFRNQSDVGTVIINKDAVTRLEKLTKAATSEKAQPKGEAVKEPWEMSKRELVQQITDRRNTERKMEQAIADAHTAYVRAKSVQTQLKFQTKEAQLKRELEAYRDTETNEINLPDHQMMVADALADGKPVPESVLADYPDLQARADHTAKLATRKAEKATNLEAAKAKVAERKEAAQARREALNKRLVGSGAIDLKDNHTITDVGNGNIKIEPVDASKKIKPTSKFGDTESAVTYAKQKFGNESHEQIKTDLARAFKLKPIQVEKVMLEVYPLAERVEDAKAMLLNEGKNGSYYRTKAIPDIATKTLQSVAAIKKLEKSDELKGSRLNNPVQEKILADYDTRIANRKGLAGEAAEYADYGKDEFSKDERATLGSAYNALSSRFNPALRSIPETDPLQGIITDRGIDYERAKDVAGRIGKGELEIKRLDPAGEQGRIKGGKRAIEASLILAANERASEEAGSRTRPVERQERALEEYAKQEGIWIDPKEFNTDRHAFIGKGVEAYVHRADNDSVSKLVDYKMIDRHATPLDFIDNRIALFNHLFPGTPYELVGFARDGSGDFRFVIKQPFIQDAVYSTAAERQAYMKGKGLTMTDKYGEAFANELHHVSDLHEKNALMMPDGTIVVIDAVPKAKVQPFTVVRPDEALRSVADTPFYSRVESVIRDKMPPRATSAQVTALLAKNSVKELDPEFQALKVYLDDQGSVSKDDVLAFVAANKTAVSEVVKGDSRWVGNDLMYGNERVATLIDNEDGSWTYESDTFSGEELFYSKEAAKQEAEDDVTNDPYNTVKPQFAQWQLPGESENYREEFLTAPPTISNFGVRLRGKNGETLEQFDNLSEAEADAKVKRFDKLEMDAVKIHTDANRGWKDGHSDYDDVVNPIARIRYNDRTTTDGDKMLFAEEFQQPSKDNIAKMPKVYQKFGEQMAIRKMLYRAVEGGYDYFGFTTGQQQADRYDLSKHVKQIRTKAWSGGNRKVEIVPIKGDDIEIEVTPDGKVVEGYKEFIGKNLDEVVGKDLAPQILEAPTDGYKVFSGLDLKIGGSGLINRYDRKHVDYINKLMKPYGVSVEAKEITGVHDASNNDPFESRDKALSILDRGGEVYAQFSGYGEERLTSRQDLIDAEEEMGGEAMHYILGDEQPNATIHAVRISPEFRKAVEASIREHGGAFPLFKVAEPNDIADIEALGKGDFKELFNDIKSDVKSDANGANILDLGTNKTIELVRTAFAYMYDTPLEGTAIPGGMYLDPSQTNDFRDALQGIADAASEAGIESKGVDTLIKNLDKAAKDGDVRVIGFDNTLPHETIHQQSRRGAIDKELSQRYSDDGLGDDPVFNKFHKKLVEIQGKASLAVAREEALAYLSSGDYARFGLTEAEATEIVAKLIESYAAKNGVQSLKTFDGTQAYEAVNEYRRKSDSRETSDDSRSEVGSERETPPETAESKRAESDTGERGETFTPGGEEKLSKTPSTLRKGGIPVQERLYTSTTDAERQAFANERMDDGLDAAMKWTRDQLDTKNNNAGATGVVGVNVMVQLGKEGRIAELNKFADDLLPAYTDSAQMIQSLAVVSMFSPDTAGAYVTKVAKQNGQDVTPEQVEKALEIATRMSEVVQADGITEHALNEAKAESERLTKDIADLTEALGLANDKNKQFKGKLSGQGRTIAALRRQIEGETKPSTRLPGAVKKHVKEIVERKDDILERLKQKYGGNPILRMVAPSQDTALRSIADTELDQDAVDAATIHLSKNLGKQTPAQVKDAINVLTNGQMTKQQIDDVYAAAVSALRIERTAMDADTKAANKLRQGHYREADKINDAKLTEWEKKLSKPDTKFVNTTVREGVENGYTDEAIWFALARKHHPNVNDALKALREEFPEADTRTIIRDSERLTQAVKARIAADIAQRQNQFTLNDEDIALIKEERRVNTHEKQKVTRDANRFYSGMVKGAGEIILDTIVNMRRANLLTAVKTHFVNIGGNVGFAIGEEIARAPSTVVDLAASIFTGERTTTLSAKAIGNGLKALVSQDETLKNSKWDTPEGKERGITAARHVLQYGGSIADMERLQHSESILSAKFENRAARWVDNYINGVFKTLGAEDAFFKVYAFRRHIEEQARAIAITERRQDKSVNLKERIKELVANPTNVMQVQADRYAHFMTFQNDNALSGFIASIKRGRPGLKAGVETIMPYDRTPTNIVVRVMEYTPAGMVIAPIRWKGAQRSFDRNKPSGLKFRNELTGAVKADLAQSEDFNNLPETERRKIIEATLQKVFTREQQETFAKTIGRSSLGTGLFSLGFVLAAAGLMAGAMSYDDDDKTESTEAEKRKKAGIENGSIQTPWGRIVLPKSPPTMAMLAGATFYEQMSISKKSPLIAAVDAGVEAFSDMAKEVPLINSTSSVLRSLGKGKFGEFTGNIASGFVPASAMLNALSNLTDDKERTGSGYKKDEKIKSPEQYLNYQGRGLRNSFIKGIPWLRQYADESTSGVSDIERGGIGRRIVRILDPFNTRTEAPPQPGTVKEMIDGVVTYAKAIGTDPITAFKIIYKGERIRRVDNNAIIVERMDLEDSQKVKKDRNASKDERLDHAMPLQLGGLNDEGNLELRPENEWARFTPVENALGRALRAEKITKEEAQKLMRDYKNGDITEADITSFKGGVVTITAGDAKPRTDLDPKNPIGNQSAVLKFKEIGSVDGLLKNNSVRYWSTDDWVAVMDAATLTDADRQLAADALRKKADNAQKSKSLTPEELERIKRVLPDYAPKQSKMRKLADMSYAKNNGRDFEPEYNDSREKWKGMRQSENVIDRREDAPLTQFMRDLNGGLDTIQRATFTGGTLAERREARKMLNEQILESRYVLKNKKADPQQARAVLKALLDARSRLR